jgi:hypothetical protein
MKTGRNKSECYVSKNDLIMVLPKGKGLVTPFGVVEDIVKTDCKVHLRGRKTVWMPAAGLCPVATQQFSLGAQTSQSSRMGEAPTHFWSIGIGLETRKKIGEVQKRILSIDTKPIGKVVKEKTMHITLAVMKVDKDEIGNVAKLIEKEFRRFNE